MLRLAFAALALVALPLAALATQVAPPAPVAPPARPAHPGNGNSGGGKPGTTKPYPRSSGGYPNNGYNQPQVYIDGNAFITPRPKTSPQHHTNTVKTSMPQETFHSYGTGN